MHDLSVLTTSKLPLTWLYGVNSVAYFSTSLPIIASQALFVLNLSYSRLVYLQKTHILIYIAT
jgi:hypothetical protein